MKITVTNNQDSGAGSLREAITTSQAGDTIAFDPSLANQTITLTSGQLTLSKNLIIDGEGVANLTISGNGASRVFLTQPSTQVTLKNIIIANGKAFGSDPKSETTSAGGGILMGGGSNLTVEKCKFINNVAGFGGGIYTGFRSITTVTDSIFDRNDGSLTTDTERGGGAIATKSGGTLTVRGSTFTNNKGTNGGAINSLLGTLTVENSTFINNDTTIGATVDKATFGYGGAIFTDGANASGPNATYGPIGGVVAIRNSRFEGNKAAGQGGALFLFVYNPDQIIVEKSALVNNQVVKRNQGESLGGGLRIGNGEFRIDSTTFNDNLSQNQGGGLAIADKASGTIVNCTFSGNKAKGTEERKGLGGAMFLNNGSNPIAIVNTTIVNNSAGFMGGAFWGGGLHVTLKNTIVANNTAGNLWNKGHHTGAEYTDGGGNIQWPSKNLKDSTDMNVTAKVKIADPLIGPLQDNGGGILTHALLSGSPAIAAGVSDAAPTSDARGKQRSQTAIDSGAYQADRMTA